MKFSSEILKSAWKIAKLTSFTWAEAIKEAIRQAIKVKEAFLKGLVTFFKTPKGDEDVEVVTRRIKPLSWFGYESKGAERKTDTIKAVDLDKYEATGNISTSIISFHGYQVL